MPGFTYKSYNFVDKDPIIDEIRTVVEDSGVTYSFIQNESGVTSNTLHAWFHGATKRPQAATINAVLRVLGYKLAIVQTNEAIVPLSKPASVRHVIQMHKYRRRKNGSV